jgi:hypothetical protein
MTLTLLTGSLTMRTEGGTGDGGSQGARLRLLLKPLLSSSLIDRFTGGKSVTWDSYSLTNGFPDGLSFFCPRWYGRRWWCGRALAG